jgi:outer membrane immunogenic protein
MGAMAADLTEGGGFKDGPPSDLAPLWNGFYIGGAIGGAWSDARVSDTFVYVGDPTFDDHLSSRSLTANILAGYSIQRGSLVAGVEGSIGYLGLSASKSASFSPGSCVGTYATPLYTVTYPARMCDIDAKYSATADVYGDLTLKLGYAVGRTLLYVKGGAAFVNADSDASYSGQNCKTLGTCGKGGPSTFHFSRSETLAGWTAGFGGEYALSRSWALRAEYRHYDFGSLTDAYSGCVSLGGTCSGNVALAGHFTSTITGKTDVSLTADAVTVGLTYRLGQ